MTEEVKQKIARALEMVPSGCFILTAGQGEEASGILASWVQQAGFDPPAVTVAVKHGRDIGRVIEKSGHFVINTLGEEQVNSPLFKRFVKGSEMGKTAFEGLQIEQWPNGVVIKDCLTHLGCELTGKMNAGDHTVFVGAVVAGDVHREGEPAVRLRSSGMNY